MKKIASLFLIFIILILGVYVYAWKVESKLLLSRTFNYYYSEEKETPHLNVVQFTDTHIGEFFSVSQFEKVVEKINKQNPDIVVFTGDLFDIGYINEEIRDQVEKLLLKINAPLGKFAIYGNRDWGGGMVRHYADIMQNGGFKVLQNEGVTVTLNGKSLMIYGADDAMLGRYDGDLLQKTIKNNENVLALVHEPDVVATMQQTEKTLFLSGHSHGGQVRLPFIGGLGKTSLAVTYDKDWYEIGNEKPNLYVSSGIGNTKFSYRFMNIPEIVVHKLHF
ncbi:MAG: metallophosphoesterase [Bacilli bacterium]